MQKLSFLLVKYAKGWIIFILFLLDGLFMGIMLPGAQTQIQGAGGPGPIDLEFFYTPASSALSTRKISSNARICCLLGPGSLICWKISVLFPC